MRWQHKLLAFGGGILAGVLLLWGLYHIPGIQRRVGWRWDAAWTALRMGLHPVGAVPTPKASPAPLVLPTQTPEARTEPPTAAPTPGISPTPIPSPTPLPPAVTLKPPRWEKQDWNNCGPATLALYLRWWGWAGDQFAISDVVKPQRGDRNVNVEELLYFVRTRAGWLNADFRVGGDLERLKAFLAAGMPIMIEEGMTLEQGYWRNDDRWAGHYLLLTGYEDGKGAFIAQDSFYGPNRSIPYAQLAHNWEAFNHVYLYIYPPPWEAPVQEILGPDADPDTNRQRALAQAQQTVETHPNDAFAWFNLGTNLVYFERYAEAAQAYDRARQIGLPQRFLRYQFGPFIAYFHSARFDDLLALADYALSITPNSEEAHLWRGWALYRLGDRQGAIEEFRAALEANPTYQDARYALQFLGVKP